MREHDAVNSVRVLAQEGEVRQHEVDSRHVGLWEHDPDVKDDQAPLDLDAGAVAADLTEPTKEDDADGGEWLSHGRCRAVRRERLLPHRARRQPTPSEVDTVQR